MAKNKSTENASIKQIDEITINPQQKELLFSIEHTALNAVHKEDICNLWANNVNVTHKGSIIDGEHIDEIIPQTKNYINSREHAILAIGEDSKILGFLTYENSEITMLFVHHEYLHYHEIGMQLLEYAIKHHEVSSVEVNERNTNGIKFYEHFGFVIDGREENDNYGKGYSIVKMHLQHKSPKHVQLEKK
jgi:putative acetyltransferase